MGIVLRPSGARGHADLGWLDSRHSFSFAHYHDPAHMGFRALRVINDDKVAPGGGFPTHGHRDMEIISYVVRGALAHRDTTGGEGVLRRGDLQAMSAGTGVRHSEFNGSEREAAHFLQIWILPRAEGLAPAYRQATIPDAAKRNQLRLLVAPDGADGALAINQDVRMFGSLLDPGKSLVHRLAPGRAAWIQVVEGEIEVNGERLATGDGAAVEAVEEIAIAARAATEFLLFDLA